MGDELRALGWIQPKAEAQVQHRTAQAAVKSKHELLGLTHQCRGWRPHTAGALPTLTTKNQIKLTPTKHWRLIPNILHLKNGCCYLPKLSD